MRYGEPADRCVSITPDPWRSGRFPADLAKDYLSGPKRGLYCGGSTACWASLCAEVAELADALASGASSRKGVEVRVLSSALHLARLFFPSHYQPASS